MGNWRTINITGTMSGSDAAALRELLGRNGHDWPGWGEDYACLSFSTHYPSLCGINDWPGPTMNVTGNLAERGYTVDDVADALRACVNVAGTMLLKAHCGGDYESETCAATISVGEGLVAVGKPERDKVSPPSEVQILGNLARALHHPK